MKYSNLPEDIKREVDKLAPRFPLSKETVTGLYLMGGRHAGKLCELKTMGVPYAVIRAVNEILWQFRGD